MARRQRLFATVANLGLRRPWLVLSIVAALCSVAGWLSTQLEVSTSRTGLVSDEQPEQARVRKFVAEFGSPDTPVFVIAGGTQEERRATVDRLQAALEAEPQFTDRVLGRLSPRDISSLLLLQQTDALETMRAALPADTDLPALVEGGIVAWFDAIAARMEAELDGGEGDVERDGDDKGTPLPGPSGGDPKEQAAAGLESLAMVADALDDHLAGRDPMERFTGAASLGQRGLDDRGYLVSGDAEHHLIAIYPQLSSDEGSALKPMVERIRSIRDAVMADAPAGVTADVTGLPAIVVDELAIVQKGLRQSTIVATIGILLLCWVLFRSVFQTLLANLPLLPGVVITLGIIELTYGHLNLITSSFVAVLLGLGVDFAVHVVSRYNEQVRAGVAPQDAVRESLQHTGPGILSGALITAVGFLAGMTTEFTAYGELGVITAVGLVAVVLCTFFVLPALLGHKRAAQVRPGPEFVGLAVLPAWIRRVRGPLVAVGIASAVASGIAATQLEFNHRYFDFMPASSESARALLALEYDPVASPVFANLTADSLEEARAITEQLRALDSVAGVQSPADLVPAMDEAALAHLRKGFAGVARDPDFAALAAHEVAPDKLAAAAGRIVDALDEVRFAMAGAGMSTTAAERATASFERLRKRLGELDEGGLARLRSIDADVAAIVGPAWTTARGVAERGFVAPTDLPPLFARRFVSKDGTRLALYAIPSGLFWEEDVATRFGEDVKRVQPTVSGLALSHVVHGQMIMRGFERAAAIAVAVVLLILIADFRNLKDALLALLPTAIGWLWMLGLMKLLGLRFDVANIVALPLVIGVGIAYGVHLMHRVREGESHAETSGVRGPARIDDAIRGTGGAIMIAALTTIVGFAALTISDYGGMQSLGWVMVIGITTCLIATIVILPAVLVMIRRAQ
jgi:predicted RND superfamily exporter protein